MPENDRRRVADNTNVEASAESLGAGSGEVAPDRAVPASRGDEASDVEHPSGADHAADGSPERDGTDENLIEAERQADDAIDETASARDSD